MGRKAEITLATFIGIVIVLLLLWFVVIPIIRTIVTGARSSYDCAAPSECMASCGEGYVEDGRGSIYCAEQTAAGEGAGSKCCEPTVLGEGQFVRGSDIKVSYQGEEIRNGETVTLLFKEGPEATGTFKVSFGPSAEKQKCYWQIGPEDTYKYSTTLTYPASADAPQIVDCSSIEGRPHEISVKENNYLSLMGEKLKFTLVVVDKDCQDVGSNPEFCDAYTFTFYAEVPDRKPAIALKMDGAPLPTSGTVMFSPGDEHEFELTIDEPLTKCEAAYNLEGPSDYFSQAPSAIEVKDCMTGRRFTKRFTMEVDDTQVRGIPFNITIATSIAGTHPRSVSQTYRFQVTPDERLIVNGPAPGLARQKDLDIVCNGECKDMRLAYIPQGKSVFDCRSGGGLEFSELKGLLENGAGRWRYVIANETHNGAHVCVKATTATGDAYVLGTWRGAPTALAIDRTPPTVIVDYNPWNGTIAMACFDDQGSAGFISGCAEKPYSYQYVVDPLKFVTMVIGAGDLAPQFNGCPDPETGAWIPHNRADPSLIYAAGEVRVVCIRAQDAAGNSAVASKLLFSSQELLAQLMREYAEMRP